MSLYYRKRGAIWYIRGTIRAGAESVSIPEKSTGCRKKSDAITAGEEIARRIKEAALSGCDIKTPLMTIAECFLIYLKRPEGVKRYDIKRCIHLNDTLGGRLYTEAPQVWEDWIRSHADGKVPSTINRYGAILQAALNAGATSYGLKPIRIRSLKEPPHTRIRYLTKEEQDRLLSSYSINTYPIFLTLCYQGLRTQEALRLQWEDIDFHANTIFIRVTKSGHPRMTPMHAKVRDAIHVRWLEKGKPSSGPVFLSRLGKAYTDTRETQTGGNPISKAHKIACRDAAIDNFRVHDWRHHWAARMVMSGCDLYTLMRLGGWSSLKMVQRYAAVSREHMDAALQRLE